MWLRGREGEGGEERFDSEEREEEIAKNVCNVQCSKQGYYMGLDRDTICAYRYYSFLRLREVARGKTSRDN